MIGYCVQPNPNLASFRFRVSIPASGFTVPYAYGTTGSPTFFYKDGIPPLAKTLKTGVVYDVVNDHFTGPRAADYHAMCQIADTVTTCSDVMAEVVKKATGRDSIVIDDPYENGLSEPAVKGNKVVWYGHSANIGTLRPYRLLPHLYICSDAVGNWSRQSELRAINDSAVILLTGKPTASTNRVVKALRAGRFVVTPGGVPAWEQFKDYIWIGDVEEGVQWALNNREEACRKILASQAYTSERFTPSAITERWMEVFDSTLDAATKGKKAG